MPPLKNCDIKVAFVLDEKLWQGGRSYLRNLLSAIHALPDADMTPIIFAGKLAGDLSREFPGAFVIRTPILDPNSAASIVRKAVRKLTFQDGVMSRFLRKQDISVLSHSGHIGGRTAIRTIGWVPDFQHVHLAELFSPAEIRHRDRMYRNMCAHCDKVIVSSECAGKDLEKFAPQYAHKAAVLKFVANPAPIEDAACLADLQRLYNFDEPYFLLPNQFWIHKNHRVVIRALEILNHNGLRLKVLATGATNDYRHPTYFSSLMDYAKECGVMENFRVLGPVPFDHLIGLMQHAVAFINPSKFEGWSTTVEEAKSMGKQIILSDIPVHQEQAPARGIFFPATNPDALAQAMLTAIKGFDEKADLDMQEQARQRFPSRQIEFGETYVRIVRDLV